MNYIEYMNSGGGVNDSYKQIDTLRTYGPNSSLRKVSNKWGELSYDLLQRFKTDNVENTPVVTSGTKFTNDDNVSNVNSSSKFNLLRYLASGSGLVGNILYHTFGNKSRS